MNVEYTIKFRGKFKPDVEAYIEGMMQETSEEYVKNALKGDIIETCRNDFAYEYDFIDCDLDVEVKIIENNE